MVVGFHKNNWNETSIFELGSRVETEWNTGKSWFFHWLACRPRLFAQGGVMEMVAMAMPQTPQYRFFTSLIDLSNDVNPTLSTRPSHLFPRIDPECNPTSTAGAKSRDWLGPALFNFSFPFFFFLFLFLLFLLSFSSLSPLFPHSFSSLLHSPPPPPLPPLPSSLPVCVLRIEET